MISGGQDKSCHGITRISTTDLFRRYSLDTTEYTHHPAELIEGGESKSPVPIKPENANLSVSFVEMVGNGDEDNWLGSERNYGNIYIEVSRANHPAECPQWSPPRPTNSILGRSDKLRVFDSIDQWQDPEPQLCRDEMNFPDQVKKRDSYTAILPGPYPTHPPGGMSNTYDQCEWGQEFQSVAYYPPKPIVPADNSLIGIGFYCVRVAESNGSLLDSTPIIQFPLAVSAPELERGIVFAHDPHNETSVLTGEAAVKANSIFKITLIQSIDGERKRK